MPTVIDRLTTITHALLDPASDCSTQHEAVADLWRLCNEVYPVAEDLTGPMHDDSRLASGKAISPIDAARCTTDFARTCAFLRAVDRAVRRSIEQRGSAHVIYAGTGPFAPLFLPLTTRYGPEQLSATLIDVHAPATEGVARCIEAFGATGHDTDIICGDATRLAPPRLGATDVLVTETMQRGLVAEPQVAILANLAPGLAPHASVVPARVIIDAWLAPPTHHFGVDPGEVHLGRVATVDREWVTAIGTQMLVECVELAMPAAIPSGHALLLTTRIELCPGVALEPHDSGLTQPLPLHEVAPVPGATAAFAYRLGADPGFECVIRP